MIVRIKQALLITILVSTVDEAFAQEPTRDTTFKTRNIAWFTPNGVSRINGLAVGIQAVSFSNKNKLEINGINADLGMLSMFGLPYLIDDALRSKAKKRPGLFVMDEPADTKVNGISISLGGEIAATINGVNVAGLLTGAVNLNGISVTGLFSRCNNFRGINVAALQNVAAKGVGLQIGLFNNCKDLKGLQIGLWNKSGKRGLPLLNWGT